MSIIIHSLPCSFLEPTFATSFSDDYDGQDSCYGFCDAANAFLCYDFVTDDDEIYKKQYIPKSWSYAGDWMYRLDNWFNNINVTDFLKASLWRQITVLGARKPSDCTAVEDRFYTTKTLTHLYNNRGVSSLDNEFAIRVSVTTKDIESRFK
jgi:hypothetical protein